MRNDWPGLKDPVDRLDSWKEIANYLKRGVRSVRLWERQEGLPVHRHYHRRRSSVYAFRSELEHWLDNRRPRTARRPPSPLVLGMMPVRDLGSGGPQANFPLGLAEEMMTQLATIDPARLAVMFRLPEDPPNSERNEVTHLDYILSGAVRSWQDQIRVTIRLTDALRGVHLWAESYQFKDHDPVIKQICIARCVAAQIQMQLLSHPNKTVAFLGSPLVCAQDSCRAGRLLMRERTISALRQAIACFEHALQVEASYAPAHAGLADSYALLGYYGDFPLLQARLNATRSAKRALQLDSQLSEAHASMGEIKAFYEWDWIAGQAEFQRAIILDSGCATSHHWYSNLLSILGRSREAIAHGLKALELEPQSPLIMAGIGLVHLYCDDPDRAVQLSKKSLQADPSYALGHWGLGLALERKGNLEQALQHFHEGLAQDPQSSCLMTSLAHAYSHRGNLQQTRALVNKLTESKSTDSAWDLAILHAGLNDNESAFRWLQQAFEDRSDWVPYLPVEGRFKKLRDDSRYSNFVNALGLA